MMYKFFPHTEEEVREMLHRIGVQTLDDLYAEVPESIRFKGDYELPESMSEIEVRQLFRQLGDTNRQLICFGGAGVYDHYAPAAIQSIISRSEFLTAYTPYQPEISQGTLHYIFEYQSMMAELTGMDISNASLYDGSTATAEAVMMCVAAAKKAQRVILSATLDPKVRAVVDTYAHFHGITIDTLPEVDGVADGKALETMLAQGDVAGVVVQQPNYYGIVEDYSGWAETIHKAKALFVVNGVAADLAVLKTPGEWGADIAVGDGQSLGIPMAYGGPYVGYMCCTEKLLRKLPGRIVGMTKDERGQRAFVLTLQAREQHIRRQKATSNICSNQSLMALFVTIYLSVMGRQGLKEAARLSYAGAHLLAERLVATGRFELAFPSTSFFNEFCVRYKGDLDALLQRCLDAGIFAGVKIDDEVLMLAVTEKRTCEEIEKLVSLV